MEVIYNAPGHSSSLLKILAAGLLLSLPYNSHDNKQI